MSKRPRKRPKEMAAVVAIPARRKTAPLTESEVAATGHGVAPAPHYGDLHELTAVGRYTPLARVNHWITAGSLILLALSGLSLFHPSLFFLSALFGGGENTRAIHPWIGIVLAVSFLGLFIRFFRLNLWEKNDSIWMGRIRSVMAGREDELPELGKYNAGQKLVFWLQSILITILVISGFGLWEVYFGDSFTVDQKRLAALVHSLAAVAAILVWIVHVYAAIWVKGTVRGMTRGDVSGGWAWRHHRRWLREEVAKEHKHSPAGE